MSYFTEKTIGELLNLKFFIPSYQRGFRWTDQQVEDLLSDIDNFNPKQVENTNKMTWYCLQPIVVKKCDKATIIENNLDDDWYEIIDGQQRLTTIFLIIHYANEMWVGKQKNPEFQIKYATRDKSYDFLQKLKVEESTNTVEINDANIDFFHISKAYDTINSWVSSYKEKKNMPLENLFFQSKFKTNSKVIWYEVPSEKDSVEIFTRINMGKIPLTNAELIKALFLNSSNFNNSDPEKIRLKQLEIASEWDRIEFALQNDEFWGFINKEENILSTRIEFLFNLLKDFNGFDNEKEKKSTFRFFADKFKLKNQEEIVNNWKEIKRLFQTLEEWFTDRVLYHKTGYLITIGIGILDLISEAHNSTKTDFKHFLTSKIAESVEFANLETLEYGKDNTKIKNILLFHNIQTMLDNKNESSRFPFDRFKDKKQGWSIEHIHAQSSKQIKNYDDFVKWYSFIEKSMISDEIRKNVNSLFQAETKDESKISELVTIIASLFGEPDVDLIENLALLGREDNSSLNNELFPIKRDRIIKSERNGSFIPICTKKVFQKYYDGCTNHVIKWESADRKAYLNDIKLSVFQVNTEL